MDKGTAKKWEVEEELPWKLKRCPLSPPSFFARLGLDLRGSKDFFLTVVVGFLFYTGEIK